MAAIAWLVVELEQGINCAIAWAFKTGSSLFFILVVGSSLAWVSLLSASRTTSLLSIEAMRLREGVWSAACFTVSAVVW